jgi:hypothetical protein
LWWCCTGLHADMARSGKDVWAFVLKVDRCEREISWTEKNGNNYGNIWFPVNGRGVAFWARGPDYTESLAPRRVELSEERSALFSTV